MSAGRLGCITTPKQGNKLPDGALWCADNGVYGKGYPGETKWWAWLVDKVDTYGTERCAFAVAPDVVADAAATRERSTPWLAKIREIGVPVAYVAQNGQEDVPIPWEAIDVLFIGGDDAYKLGPAARDLCHEAKTRGKWVHVGRINTARRYAYAATPYANGGMGADSCDGTKLRFGADVNLPHLLEFTDRTLV